MSQWFSDPAAPAWVQAIGSVLAIIAAFAIPAWQRHQALSDALSERRRADRENLKRVSAGLRSEISLAVDAGNRQQFSMQRALARVDDARKVGMPIKEAPVHAGSMVLTDAVVFRQVASDLGRFPADLVQSLVHFYGFAAEFVRLVEMSSSAEESYRSVLPLIPRFNMSAACLVAQLDKFAAAGFDDGTDLKLNQAEIRKLAAQVGYPIEEILGQRGFDVARPNISGDLG